MVEYNYAFQVGEVGVEFPRSYGEAQVQQIISKDNSASAIVATEQVSRQTIGGSQVLSRTDYITTTADLPGAMQDISGTGSCGVNSGCRVVYFVTKSIGVSDSQRDNSPKVTLYGGLRKQVVDEVASGVFRETD
jgi:hypothetical protein